MRIHLVCADPGIPVNASKGASEHLRSLYAALRQRGHAVELFAARPAERIGVYPVPVRPLADLAHAPPPDVVYERLSLGHRGGLAAARTWGVPFALEVNAPLTMEARRYRPYALHAADEAIEAELLRAADLVVCVSSPLRRWVRRVRGTDEGTAFVPNGCDPSRYPLPAHLTGRSGQRLVFLGDPKPWHGTHLLAELLAALRLGGFDPVLEVIGPRRSRDGLWEAARRLGVSDRIRVTGPLSPPAIFRHLYEAAVAVAPYPPLDPFYFCPLKILDCMAAGLPVVTTAQGDLPYLVGRGGRLVPPGDPAALCAAVAELLADEKLRRALGAAARARVRARFTWAHTAARIERRLRALPVVSRGA